MHTLQRPVQLQFWRSVYLVFMSFVELFPSIENFWISKSCVLLFFCFSFLCNGLHEIVAIDVALDIYFCFKLCIVT